MTLTLFYMQSYMIQLYNMLSNSVIKYGKNNRIMKENRKDVGTAVFRILGALKENLKSDLYKQT